MLDACPRSPAFKKHVKEEKGATEEIYRVKKTAGEASTVATKCRVPVYDNITDADIITLVDPSNQHLLWYTTPSTSTSRTVQPLPAS